MLIPCCSSVHAFFMQTTLSFTSESMSLQFFLFRSYVLIMCCLRYPSLRNCSEYYRHSFKTYSVVEILQRRAKFQTTMVSCSRIIWVTNYLDHIFVCKRFAVQTHLWSLEFVIQIIIERDSIAVWNLAQSWSIST